MYKIMIIILLLVIAVIIIYGINTYNKYQYYKIKINKADNTLKNLLQKKFDILVRFLNTLKEYVEIDEEKFPEINININNHDLDKQLNDYYNNIESYLDINNKIIKKDNISAVIKELKEINVKIDGCKNYFNHTITSYNKMVNYFPSNIIAKMYKYREKEFFHEEENIHFKIIKDTKKDD